MSWFFLDSFQGYLEAIVYVCVPFLDKLKRVKICVKHLVNFGSFVVHFCHWNTIAKSENTDITEKMLNKKDRISKKINK